MAPANSQEPCSLAQLLAYFLRLGTFGFGRPIALAGRMDRDLVEERGWVSRQDYVEGLAFSQLSPGPLAAQLAMYIGWVRAGRLGAALVRSEEHTSEFQSRRDLVCRLLLAKQQKERQCSFG